MSLYLLLLMGALMVLTTAQPLCDPQSQYEQDGHCCNMCGKGTYMTTFGTCEEPQCSECPDKEYQEGFTKKHTCEPQPYCDPNLNFEVPLVHSKTARTVCKCKEGFHCSSEDCKVCLPHKKCEPGYEVQLKGNHTHDTVCKECPKGTFSNETSWFSQCKKWTLCEAPFHTEQKGTSTSDSKCVKPSRLHIAIICVPLVAIVIAAVVVIIFICRGIAGPVKEKAKPCLESCLGDDHKPFQDTDTEVKTPVEDIEADPDQTLLELSSEGHTTVMGNPVREEDGKSEIIARQESQPETCSSLI